MIYSVFADAIKYGVGFYKINHNLGGAMASRAPAALREIAADIEHAEREAAKRAADILAAAGDKKVNSAVVVENDIIGQAGFSVRDFVNRDLATSIGRYVAERLDLKVTPDVSRYATPTTRYEGSVYVFTRAQLHALIESALRSR